ncbi:MAG: hypothetical protein U5Q44_09340 [Dehalococcoidia bacterium]|nr:hypothetical protein [Dehalococcoidia bacterium]
MQSVLGDAEVEGVKSNLPLLLEALVGQVHKEQQVATKSLETIRERLAQEHQEFPNNRVARTVAREIPDRRNRALELGGPSALSEHGA